MKITNKRKRADRVIEFIEKLKVPSGKGAGQCFKLNRFQKRFIRAVYEPHHKPEDVLKRIVRNAILSIARKNGKTALIACIVLVHLVGPEAEENNEIYSAANDKEQAAQVFVYCQQIIEANPSLSAILRVIESKKTISCYANGSKYQALSREAGTKHGKNPGLVIYDELAQAKDMDLFEVLDSAMGARAEPLMLVISTQSKDPQHILSQMIDDGLSANDPTTVCHLYAVDDSVLDEKYCKKCKVRTKVKDRNKSNLCPKCETKLVQGVYDPKVCIDANPALGKFLYIDYIKAKAERAERMPAFENSYLNLHLNMRVDQQASLISRKEWQGCEDQENTLIDGEDIYLGLDLSAKTDLSALVAISARNGDRVVPFLWKPKATLAEHEKRDRAPYAKWEKEGHLLTCPGKTIRYGDIALKLAELDQKYNILGVAYDRHRIDVLINEMEHNDIDCYEGDLGEGVGIRLVPFGQGFVSMGPAVEEMDVSIKAGTFHHNGNPVLTWNFSNAVALSDPAGNLKLDKQKARFRIDGAVSTVMAKGLKAKDMVENLGDINDFINNPVRIG